MIRWRFLLTRLLIVAGVLMLLRWGLGPVARYVSQRAIEAATGARADIAEAEIGLFPPRLRFADVRVADPRTGRSDRDAWRADSIELEIDGDALLRRRWVARRGRITGLQIGSRRDTSGHFEPASGGDLEDSPGTSSMLSQLVRSGVDGLDKQASALVDELETVRRSRAIREKWENEFETLASRGKQLERQIRDLRDQAKSVDNPLRDLPQFERALTRANEVRGELTAVKERIDSLPERFRADLASLKEAKRIDLERVDRYVPGDVSESGEFGVEVVRAAVRERLEQLRGYLDRGRELAGYTVVSPQADRVRGETFDLLGENRPPQVLVRRCEVSGLMRSGGRTYAVSGVVENLTPSPQRLRKPTRARLLVESAGPEVPEVIRAEYVRDRRQGKRVDRLTLLWPQSEGHPMRLGGGDVAIAVRGGKRELWAQLVLRGDEINGRFVSKQTGLDVRLQTDPRYAQTPVATALGESLAAVDRIEVDARFDGTWNDLDLRLETNLERIVRDATADAIDRQVRATRKRLASRVNETHSRETRSLEQWLGNRQEETRSLIAGASESVEAMFDRVSRGIGSPDAYLGKLRSALDGIR